jgi:BTB/POZ domain
MAAAAASIVELNVGGTLYTTSRRQAQDLLLSSSNQISRLRCVARAVALVARYIGCNNSTLTSEPDSMLARMFNGQLDSATDAHGRVFIDRDGSLFATVLEYLRNADYELPDSVAKGQLQALRREADFFQLRGLKAAVETALALTTAAAAADAAAEATVAASSAAATKPPTMEYRVVKGEYRVGLLGLPSVAIAQRFADEGWQVQCVTNRPAGANHSDYCIFVLARAKTA